jgi:hypothetical protein
LDSKIIPKVQHWYNNVLTVIRNPGPLVLERQTCFDYEIPEKYRTEGESEYDVILFIHLDTVSTVAEV